MKHHEERQSLADIVSCLRVAELVRLSGNVDNDNQTSTLRFCGHKLFQLIYASLSRDFIFSPDGKQ